jgi:hypothetical protein
MTRVGVDGRALRYERDRQLVCLADGSLRHDGTVGAELGASRATNPTVDASRSASGGFGAPIRSARPPP